MTGQLVEQTHAMISSCIQASKWWDRNLNKNIIHWLQTYTFVSPFRDKITIQMTQKRARFISPPNYTNFYRLHLIISSKLKLLLLWCIILYTFLPPDRVRCQLFNCQDYLVLERMRTCLKISSNPMFLMWISNSSPVNLLLV